MRAMVLEAPKNAGENPLRLLDITTPSPDAREIRVRVQYCGVCHTDWHIVEGELPLPKLPLVPGHQIVGVVDALGSNAHKFREGDRVGIPWLHSTDNICRYCLSGNENLCDRAQFTGYHVNGGYAESIIVGEDFAYALPHSFSEANAAPLLCAGIIGYRSFRLSNVQKGELLGLYGFGASAHIVLQFARYLGCEVYVLSRTPAHRELATSLGAAWVGGSDEKPPHELDAAIIFAPSGQLAITALRAVRRGGTVALAGITMSPIPQFKYAEIYHEKILRSVANSTRQDALDFLELAAEVPVHTEIEVFQLEQANLALQKIKHSQIKGAAVLRVAT